MGYYSLREISNGTEELVDKGEQMRRKDRKIEMYLAVEEGAHCHS